MSRRVTLLALALMPVLVVIMFAAAHTVSEMRTQNVSQSYELAIGSSSVRVEPLPQVATTTPTSTNALWFVGDVMLSRQVGQFAASNGHDYPWRGVTQVFGKDLVLANFESCFSPTKTFTREHSMRFPVDPVLVDWMRVVGITHVSQANNHGLDCGQADLDFSRKNFIANGIVPIGHPVRVDDTSVTYVELGEQRIGILAFHTLFSPPATSELESIISSMASSSDLQVVFVHWGDEYIQSAVPSQRLLARELARLGIDLVIGHHPHVVQDIERIDDTLVVYSLGNFIFDQYFSVPVQQGLITRLVSSPEGLSLSLVPVSTQGTPTQPHLMSEIEARSFLSEMAARSDARLSDQVMAGTIDLNFLATSTKSSIIAEPTL